MSGSNLGGKGKERLLRSDTLDSTKSTSSARSISAKLFSQPLLDSLLKKQTSPRPLYKTYEKNDPEFQSALKFPPDLTAAIQNKILRKLGLQIDFISFRVNQIGTEPTRRNSLRLDDQIANAGKPVTAKQKTQPMGFFGAGQLVAHEQFLTAARGLSLLDNNELGSFPITAKKTDADLIKLRANENPDIMEVRTAADGLLIFYSKLVQQYDYDKNPLRDPVLNIPLKKRKVYQQSADSLKTVLKNLQSGSYILQPGSNAQQLILKDSLGNLAMLDLNKIIGVDGKHLVLSTQLKDQFQDLISKLEMLQPQSTRYKNNLKRITDDFINKNLSSNNKDTDLAKCHLPIFKQGDLKKEWVPFMVSCEGYAITSDADAEHIAIPNHLPAVVHKMFNSFKPNSSEGFINGLKILIARLEAKNRDDFLNACEAQGFSQKVLRDYLCSLELDHPNCFVVYDEKLLLKRAKKVLQKVSTDKTLLSRVGVMNVFTLLVKLTLKNPYFLHGSEELHPFAKPEDFGGILSFIKPAHKAVTKDQAVAKNHAATKDQAAIGQDEHKETPYELAQTDDEETYIQFIFANPKILIHNSINVHPYWLRQRMGAEQKLSDAWLKVLEVQALVQLRRGIIDSKDKKIPHAEFDVFYEDYKGRLTVTMQQGRGNVDEYAGSKISAMFERIDDQYLSASKAEIEARISTLFHEVSNIELNPNSSEFNAEKSTRRTSSGSLSSDNSSGSSGSRKIRPTRTL